MWGYRCIERLSSYQGEMKKIKLRGHHLFCLQVVNLQGDPIYNPKHCANNRKFQEMMCSNPNEGIEIVRYCGDTCAFCPSWKENDNKCILYDYEDGANKIDMDMLESLDLEIGDEITSKELRRRIKNKFGDTLPDMCNWACPFAEILQCGEGLKRIKTVEARVMNPVIIF